MFRPRPALAVALLTLLAVATSAPLHGVAPAPDPTDTRMLSQPAVSGTHVAFVYANDLWSARLDGSDVRRLTTHPGVESSPVFSPDGERIAFSGQYDGNTDVYVVPVQGGVPERLTWHPGPDRVRDWTRDGSAVLFTSARSVHTTRHTQLFTVPVDGGMPERLPIPHAWWASISPDGDRIAYTPIADRHQQWKNYRGGTQARIWVYDRGDHSVQEVPKPEAGSNDTQPVWLGDEVYFLSDRDGELNLYSWEPAAEDAEVRRHTFHDDFPILSHGTDGDAIVYEQAGWLHRWEPGTGRVGERLAVGVAADLIERRARWVRDEPQWIRDAHVSPSGARAVFEFRGEIVTVPAEHGDPRNLTRSVDAHDRSPAWSPDGSRIAFFSDAGGEYRLHLIDQRGEGPERVIPVEGHGFYEDIVFSPDGDKILYTDNSMALYLLDLETERAVQIAKEPYYGPFKTISGRFSPDGEWIAYTVPNDADFRQVWLYRIADGARFPVTDGLSDAFSPVFDASGKHLYLLASTDAGPLRGWFAMSNADAEASSSIYVAVLAEGAESPLKARSDEEPVRDDAEADDGDDGENGDASTAGGDGTPDDGPSGDDDGDQAAGDDEEPLTYDLDDIHQRIVALPLPAADYSSLQAGEEDHLYYLRRDPGNGFGEFAFGPASLRMYDLDAREEKSLADGVAGFALTDDDSKMLVAMPGNTWLIAPAGQPVDPSKGRLAVDEIEVKIDPVAEWEQIYREAWRINRDYFYDPNFHGADWEAMGEKYSEFLGHLATRDDLNRVIRWMASELAVGHSYLGGGDTLVEVDEIPGGLLGADFEVADGRYRLAKVYGGLNWNPDLRSPLTEPGVDAREGEYLLAVDGEELRPPDNLHARFENTAGEQVEITLGPSPDGTDSRTVTVVPVESEANLRNRDWVEGNIDAVTAATDGRVAYVYVPNTAGLGHTYFKRYFFPQANRDAIIVDERYNGGGQVADYYIDMLRRPHIAHWATRYGRDYETPFYSIQGPKVMIIDETAGSGGDLLPWMFRKLEMGPLVGKRTWGGLVGILGFPTLMDGGSITAPNLAIWTEDGFVVENVGVPPDHEVEQLPAEVIAGRDPQLERAIELALQMLEENPPPEHDKPEYPIRVRQQ